MITLTQATLFVLFLINALWLFCSNIKVLFALMVTVGLMGGSSYVNVLYLVKRTNRLEKTEKELAMNVSTISNDIGIISASTIALILSLTAFIDPV